MNADIANVTTIVAGILRGQHETTGYVVETYRPSIDFVFTLRFDQFAWLVAEQNMPATTGLETSKT